MFLRATNGTLYNTKFVKSIYIDNVSATNWFVAVIMADTTVFHIAENLATSSDANAVLVKLGATLGVANPV